MSVEQKLGYFFFDKQILNRALTRKAYALERRQQNEVCEDQEIYRTLGDSVLKTVLVEFLIRAGASTRQEITVKKIELEREEKLAAIGRRLGLGDFIRLGTGERKQNAGEQPYVLAETVEALIGGIYLDGGFGAARQTVKTLYHDDFPEL
ncbi:MAG TPA: dsRNA-specific ribonuclease [Synechococcales cyanobacterium M55_K2018_004]|nr:dsRNA-specific ribonuclease [Synechococcales cyanobacterium M55_K2018_004]